MAKAKALIISLFFLFCFFMCLYLYGNSWRLEKRLHFRAKSEENR